MSHQYNEQHQFSDSRHNEHQALPHVAILVFQGSGLALVLFLIAGTWALLGFKPAFILIAFCCVIGVGAWLFSQIRHHWHDIADRKHMRILSQIAIENGHSVEYKPATRELRTISPYTIPNGALTIKDVNIGNATQLAPVLPTAPAFSSLISQIRPGHLFLAQGQSKPIWGDITDLLSTLDVGRPGTGKSTLLRCVCAQVLLIGGQPIIFDPHGSILDDLGSEFQCAESPREISEYAHLLDTQLTQRLAARRAGRVDFKPLLLLVDEMPIISEMSPDALPAIRRVVLEGRKVGMYALISGQGVPSSILGGTLVRDAMASRYVFCTSPQQARMAGIENETAKQMMAILEDAGPGKAVLATANRRPEIVAIPDTSVDDIRFLLNRNVPEAGNISPIFRNRQEQPAAPFYVDVPDVPDVPLPVTSTLNYVPVEEQEQIIRLYKSGIKRRDMCAALGKGKAYYDVVKVVLDDYQQAEGEA